jgi:hypothetical protein
MFTCVNNNTIECHYQGVGIYCLTFREICGDAPYSPMCWDGGVSDDNIKVIRKIFHHKCQDDEGTVCAKKTQHGNAVDDTEDDETDEEVVD